jgi:N-acylneuraminate cytidylyltransferase
MRLAVIPARGGSKRIPRKNIRSFCGKPIIAWSIAAALDSGLFDQVLVSTDDAEIAEVSRALGALAPFVRPASLSDDLAGTSPVVAHAVRWYRGQGVLPQLACCIYATAPFVTADDLRNGLRVLLESGAKFAFAATSYAFPIQRAIRINADGRASMFQPENFSKRSQDLEPAYHDAGQYYWGLAEAWCDDTPLFGADSCPVILPRHRVQDIDTMEDWERAQWLFRAMAGT